MIFVSRSGGSFPDLVFFDFCSFWHHDPDSPERSLHLLYVQPLLGFPPASSYCFSAPFSALLTLSLKLWYSPGDSFLLFFHLLHELMPSCSFNNQMDPVASRYTSSSPLKCPTGTTVYIIFLPSPASSGCLNRWCHLSPQKLRSYPDLCPLLGPRAVSQPKSPISSAFFPFPTSTTYLHY